MKVLFLDVDGVLNGHNRYPNGYCGLDRLHLGLLDRIVAETGCRIVLVSAWRYILLGGDMTLKGFGYLMLTHGAAKETADALTGYLSEDGSINDLHDRGKLASEWLDMAGELLGVTRAVALDDGSWPDGFDLGYEVMGIPSVRPRGGLGMSAADADLVIAILNAQP